MPFNLFSWNPGIPSSNPWFILLSKAYLMVYNSLTLESWKVRRLRLGLESLTNFGSFFTFSRRKSANFKKISAFSSKNFQSWVVAIFDDERQKFGKISQRNLLHSVLSRYIPKFLEKLESWLDRLNTPLTDVWAVSFYFF